MKKIIFLCFTLCFSVTAFAETSDVYNINDYITPKPHNTKCATGVFAKALANNAHMVEFPDEASTSDIDAWAHYTFSKADVLYNVLNCPEIKAANDNDTIIFEPISYTFPNGRTISINYETQKGVLRQKYILTTKPKLTDSDISPDIYADAVNGTTWVNVDPAWYAILVAEHGTLDKFVNPGKQNVVALRYIQDNIKTLYPKNHNSVFKASCTSKTAWADDTDMINRAATVTVGGRIPRDENAPRTEAETEQEKLAKSNDFYVMGDGDLSWVSTMEVVADAVITVATYGGFTIVKGFLTASRGMRTFAKSQKILKELRTSHDVSNWLKVSKRSRDIEQAIKITDNVEDSYKAITKIEHTAQQTVESLTRELDLLKAKNTNPKVIKQIEEELKFAEKSAASAKKASETAEKMAKIDHTLKNGKELSASKQKSLSNLEEQIQKVTQQLQKPTKPLKSSEAKKLRSKLKTLQQKQNTIKNETKLSVTERQQLEKELSTLKETYSKQLTELKTSQSNKLLELEKLKDVQNYKDVAQAERDAARAAYMMRQGKIAFQAQRGLLPMRALRTAKTLRTGFKDAKKLDKATKIVRANTSGISAKVNDWLFHNTMKNLSAISKVPAQISLLNMIVKIGGDLYDKTEISTGDFTNNIEMKPFLLLGADDTPGYENVINYGMWLFWTGSSTSAADDDAAFLQAMSFAEKFHQDLVEIQDYYNVMACDVDIYVVRPIIRNPGTEKQELYYLFMNDTPWTTHGYNEPNDGSGKTSLKKRSEESSTPAPDDDLSTELNKNTYSDQNLASVQTNQNIGVGTVSKTAHGIKYYEPPYDGTKIGQPCTPLSSSAGGFTSEVYKSGRYAKYPAFEKAMSTKFRTEGSCGDTLGDSGGYTCYGVSSKFFPQVKNPNFSRNDAEDIGFNSFYKPYHLDKLPDAISGDVFMALWGTGSRVASIGLLQKLLGVEQTNTVNQETIEAAKNYKGDLRTQFLNEREKRFRSGKKAFRKGWLNALEVYRANGCHTIAE